MEQIEGGVTAPQGFSAAGIHCGVKATSQADKKDLAMILSSRECTAAAVYTRNRVKAAPLFVTRENLRDGRTWGVVANSGNANACAPGSMENARAMCRLAAAATGRKAEDFVVASTGVIGQELNLAAIERGIPQAAAALSPEGSDSAAHAIMTTDTYKKEFALAAEIDGRQVRIGAIAKGSGMIHPNMGTMLCFITTDCQISAPCLQQALEWVVERTFNRVTVDGDTSTNDTCAILANGMAGNPAIQETGEAYNAFLQALYALCQSVARAIAADGEGASRLLTCTVRNAADEKTAETLAKAVVSSSLVKAAMFGADANWGRVLCAMGYSGGDFQPEKTDLAFRSCAGEIPVCRAGAALDFDETLAKEILSQSEVIIDADLHQGEAQATCWGCDLTYDYVKINGDYRT